MSRPPRLGEYRHQAYTRPDPSRPDARQPAKVRRRFRHLGAVALCYAFGGPVVCLGVSAVLRLLKVTPQTMGAAALPPSPSIENVLLGAGLPEVALASMVAGLALWQVLWRNRWAAAAPTPFWSLLALALPLGGLFTVLVAPLGIFGMCLRAAPAEVPLWVRPLYAIPAVVAASVMALIQPAVTPVLMVLSITLSLRTAAAVALLWRTHPEEPDTRG